MEEKKKCQIRNKREEEARKKKICRWSVEGNSWDGHKEHRESGLKGEGKRKRRCTIGGAWRHPVLSSRIKKRKLT